MAEFATIGDFLDSKWLSSKLQLSTTLTIGDILISLLITFLIALFIYHIYKKTYSGVLYSQEFNVTLVVVSLVVSVIMIGISRNLALSLGLIGALSIVRFRNAVKDPRDVAFLFWAISVGIVNGVQFYKLAIVSSAFIGIVLLVFSRRMVFREPYMIILKSSTIDEKALHSIMEKHCQKYKLRSTSWSADANERSIEARIKPGQEQELAAALKKLKGVQQTLLFSHTGRLSD